MDSPSSRLPGVTTTTGVCAQKAAATEVTKLVMPGVSRTMGFPQVALDPRSGTLYVSWSDYRNGDVDVFLSRSTDRGRTWSAPPTSTA